MPKSKLKLHRVIPFKDLAQYRHVKFLITQERQAIVAYKFVMLKMNAELKKLMKKKKLAKSDDPTDGLESGWTGEIPTIEVDLEALTSKVIDKYMSGLKWILMGDFAGAEAKKAAEAIGLKGKATPGIVHAAYLQSLDSHAQHYKDVTGQDAPEMPVDLVEASFDQIAKRVGRFVDQTLDQLKLDVIGAVDRKIVDHNFKALNEAHSEAHDALPQVGASEAVAEAGEGIADVLSARGLDAELKRTADNFEKKWDLAVRTDLAMASAAGTHQALLEIHGADNPDVRVVNVEMEDERVCTYCRNISKKPDGSWIKYRMNELQPSGYNFSRKRADWKISVSPQHPRCRCQTVYLPPGFEMDEYGGMYKK